VLKKWFFVTLPDGRGSVTDFELTNEIAFFSNLFQPTAPLLPGYAEPPFHFAADRSATTGRQEAPSAPKTTSKQPFFALFPAVPRIKNSPTPVS
jgi:hypothetical protein